MNKNPSLSPKSGILPKAVESLTGPVPVHMCNDYLFRAMMQQDPPVLKALVCSLLYLEPQAVTGISILNPIELGEAIDEKTYMLDTLVSLNGRAHLNLELQVINEGDWPERSLCYLGRTFSSMNRGENYLDARPAIQIGILNFTLFEEHPEFFSNYYMINEKTHQIYSRKFRLCVLDLTQIKLATKQDREHGLDKWAALFKAATWEELKMLAREDENLQSAVCTVARLTKEEKIRLQCEAREDYYRRTAGRERLLKETTAKLGQTAAKLDQAVAARDQFETNWKQATAERDQAAAERDWAVAELEKALRVIRERGIAPSEAAGEQK